MRKSITRHRDPAPHDDGGLAARLRTALGLLPRVLGGAPTQPLALGRATRVLTAAQRTALMVQDGSCRFPGGARPVAWCQGHHLRHRLHGGATDQGTWWCGAGVTIVRCRRAAGGLPVTPTGS